MPAEIAGTLSDENSTSNFHHWCLTEQKFDSSTLPNFYKILSTNEDDKGLQFISSMEAIKYPIWGTQFHPEKNIYEWGYGYKSIPHTTHAVHAGQYFADFFINQGDNSPIRSTNHTDNNQLILFFFVFLFLFRLNSSKELARIPLGHWRDKALDLQLSANLHWRRL